MDQATKEFIENAMPEIRKAEEDFNLYGTGLLMITKDGIKRVKPADIILDEGQLNG